MMIPLSKFESLVVEALDGLPPEFLETLDNVDVIVEREPTREQRDDVGEQNSSLLGLYEGIPQSARTSNYGMVLPDKITIFYGPIVRLARDENDVRTIVQETVVHEIAHHFGISDDRLRELGVY